MITRKMRLAQLKSSLKEIKKKLSRKILTKPFKFQIEGFRKIKKLKGRALLADEMGLGKTLQALMYANHLINQRKPKGLETPIVVMCPASVKWQWQNEILKHLGKKSVVLEKKTPGFNFNNIKHVNRDNIFIVNYDILGTIYGTAKTWNKFFRKLKPELVVLDETHYIKNRKAKRTRYTRDLCEKVKRVIAISGTPLTNRPAELWPTLHVLNPSKWASFKDFGERYCQPEYTRFGVQYKGASNLGELHRKLTRSCMIRRKKMDVLKDLPAKTRTLTPVTLKDMAQYVKAEREFLKWLKDTHPDRYDKTRHAQMIVQMGYLKRLAGTLKLPTMMEWIDTFLEETEDKIVIFGVHKGVLHPLREKYEDISVLVDGGITGRKRQLAVDLFTKKKSKRIFFGNIVAAGVGLNLTVATHLAFAEINWTPGEHVQAEDRIHRIGQKNAAMINYLLAKNTIEEDLAKLIQIKQGISDAVLDGGNAKGGFDVYSQLEKVMSDPNYHKESHKKTKWW